MNSLFCWVELSFNVFVISFISWLFSFKVGLSSEGITNFINSSNIEMSFLFLENKILFVFELFLIPLISNLTIPINKSLDIFCCSLFLHKM